MSAVRIGILSATGTARKRTIPAIVGEKLGEIVAIHGRDPAKLATLAAEYAIPRAYLDTAELLDGTRPDFVYLASPPALHAEQIRLCLARGIPVLCEKPLCLSAAEADELIGLPAKTGVPVRVAHHLRHQPGLRALRGLLAEGTLGPVRRASFQWAFWLNEESGNARWKLDPALGGPNAFYDAGIHAVDLLLHLLPAPTQIAALGGHARFSGIVDNLAAVARCGDAVVELSASLAIRSPRNDLTLDCEAGTIVAPHALGERPFTRIEITSTSGTTVEEFPPVNPYAEEIRDFIGLLEGKPSSGTTLEEARQALAVLEAITTSYESGKTIMLSP